MVLIFGSYTTRKEIHMSITKTLNNTYRVRSKYPKDIQIKLGLKNPYFDKIFKTRKEAKDAELEFKNKIKQLKQGKSSNVFELGGEISFLDFYYSIWLDAYKNGATSSYSKLPSLATISQTEMLFRTQILPLFGSYSLNYLNQNKAFVMREMTQLAQRYVNVKILISYINQLFDLAEELEYIEYNRLTKMLKKIKPIKKLRNKDRQVEEDKYLSEKELVDWFQAIEKEFQEGRLSQQDYTLFWVTYFLSDRKSESYALKWKAIDFDSNVIHLEKALDKFGNIKSTKADKETDIIIPQSLRKLLLDWKEQQNINLKRIGLNLTPEQYLFTYTDRQGNINKPVYHMYLNHRMRLIEKRYPYLVHATPHKLRHTSATLAKIYGMSLEEISNGLTHSGTKITETYVNNRKVVQMTPADFAYRNLKNLGVN